jgi:ribosomal protein L14
MCFCMFQKLTNVGVADGTGAGWLQIFHIYRGSFRKYSKIGDFVKMSVKSVVSYPRFIRGKKYRPLRAGFVVRGLCINSKVYSKYIDMTRVKFISNKVLLIKRRGLFKSKYLYTPLLRVLNKKQYFFFFKYII